MEHRLADDDPERTPGAPLARAEWGEVSGPRRRVDEPSKQPGNRQRAAERDGRAASGGLLLQPARRQLLVVFASQVADYRDRLLVPPDHILDGPRGIAAGSSTWRHSGQTPSQRKRMS